MKKQKKSVEESGKIIANNRYFFSFILVMIFAGAIFYSDALFCTGYILALSVIVNLMMKK